MKYFACFFTPSATDPTNMVPACGDRSVIQLDGRMSRENMHRIAEDECRKRGYKGYTIERGRTLAQTFALTLPRFIKES